MNVIRMILLSGALMALAENMPGTIGQIDKEGLLGWVDKNDPSIDMQRSWRQGNCHVRLGKNKDACFLIQWLFLMCGIPLNEVDFYYDRYTDENWRIHQQKIRHQQEIQKQLEVSREKKLNPSPKLIILFSRCVILTAIRKNNRLIQFQEDVVRSIPSRHLIVSTWSLMEL